jgi:hypothetical protein
MRAAASIPVHCCLNVRLREGVRASRHGVFTDQEHRTLGSGCALRSHAFVRLRQIVANAAPGRLRVARRPARRLRRPIFSSPVSSCRSRQSPFPRTRCGDSRCHGRAEPAYGRRPLRCAMGAQRPRRKWAAARCGVSGAVKARQHGSAPCSPAGRQCAFRARLDSCRRCPLQRGARGIPHGAARARRSPASPGAIPLPQLTAGVQITPM